MHNLAVDGGLAALLVGGIVRVQDLERLLDLRPERLGTLEEVEQLGVVHLEQHTGNLPGEVRLRLVDERVQPLPDHVLLYLGRGARERRGRELLVRARRGVLLLLLGRRALGHVAGPSGSHGTAGALGHAGVTDAAVELDGGLAGHASPSRAGRHGSASCWSRLIK